jgi:cytosine deaminase
MLLTFPVGRPTEAAELQAAGYLVLPAPAEPHAHLDKALTADRVDNPDGDLMGAIRAWLAYRSTIAKDDFVERATRALLLGLANGCTSVRSHVDVGDDTSMAAVDALVEVRAALAGTVDLQLVGLVGLPTSGAAGAANRAALIEALDRGVDIVGGCPHLDPDPRACLDDLLQIATDRKLPLDLHTDENLNPASLDLELLADAVSSSGFGQTVVASHCVSLGIQPEAVQRRVAEKVAAAGIGVVALPQTNLFLQGRDHPTATPRGLTAIRALRDAGVVVAAGADNVQDPFNLVGRSDPLETAALLVMAGHQLPDHSYGMVSNDVRRALGLPVVTFQPGDPADLVAIEAPSIRAAIADAPRSRRVFRRGRLVASCDQQFTVHR